MWEELWRQGTTPWDLGDITPPLQELLKTQKGLFNGMDACLVPGCGRGYDLSLLAATFNRVVGLDISKTAVDQCRKSLQNSMNNIAVKEGDFFGHHDVYDAVYDYTFFCAIEPNQRDEWAKKMRSLVKPAGLLIALIFPVMPGVQSRGYPPHPVSLDECIELLRGNFELVHCNRTPKSHPTRIGKEIMAVFRRL